MSKETKRFKIPYPSRSEDDYYETFVDGMSALDSCVFADFEHRNHIFHGGEEISWFEVGSDWTLSWTEDIGVQSPAFGQYITLGPDTGPVVVPPGYFLYLTVPRGPTKAVEIGLAETASQIPINNATMTLAWHNPANNKLIWRTGLVIEPNSVVNNGVFPITEVTYVAGDATSVHGVPICLAAETPADGDLLRFDSTLGVAGEWCLDVPDDRHTRRYIVGKDASAQYYPGNPDAGKHSIQDAINDAFSAGGQAVVFIQEGEYSENLVLKPGVDIIGAAPAITGSRVEDGFGAVWRTVIEGKHTVEPYTFDPLSETGNPPLGAHSIGVSNIRFSYSPPGPVLNDAVITFLDLIPVGAELGLHQLNLSMCARAEWSVSPAGDPAQSSTTQFMRSACPNSTNLSKISGCYLEGGTADSAAGIDGTQGVLYFENASNIAISDSYIGVAQDSSALTPGYRPSIGISDAVLIKITDCDLSGMVSMRNSPGMFSWIDMHGSKLVANTFSSVDNTSRAAFYCEGGDTIIEMKDSSIASTQGTQDGTWYAITGAATSMAVVGYSDVSWSGAQAGDAYRAGTDPNFISASAFGRVAAESSAVVDPFNFTEEWSYRWADPGIVHSGGTAPAAGGSYFGKDLYIDGKLTVTGLIDPTGLVLDEQAVQPAANVPAKGHIWIIDNDGTGKQDLYFTDQAGTTYSLTQSSAGTPSASEVSFDPADMGGILESNVQDVIEAVWSSSQRPYFAVVGMGVSDEYSPLKPAGRRTIQDAINRATEYRANNKTPFGTTVVTPMAPAFPAGWSEGAAPGAFVQDSGTAQWSYVFQGGGGDPLNPADWRILQAPALQGSNRVTFSIWQGAYDPAGLNLEAASAGQSIHLQVSENGADWFDLYELSPNPLTAGTLRTVAVDLNTEYMTLVRWVQKDYDPAKSNWAFEQLTTMTLRSNRPLVIGIKPGHYEETLQLRSGISLEGIGSSVVEGMHTEHRSILGEIASIPAGSGAPVTGPYDEGRFDGVVIRGSGHEIMVLDEDVCPPGTPAGFDLSSNGTMLKNIRFVETFIKPFGAGAIDPFFKFAFNDPSGAGDDCWKLISFDTCTVGGDIPMESYTTQLFRDVFNGKFNAHITVNRCKIEAGYPHDGPVVATRQGKASISLEASDPTKSAIYLDIYNSSVQYSSGFQQGAATDIARLEHLGCSVSLVGAEQPVPFAGYFFPQSWGLRSSGSIFDGNLYLNLSRVSLANCQLYGSTVSTPGQDGAANEFLPAAELRESVGYIKGCDIFSTQSVTAGVGGKTPAIFTRGLATSAQPKVLTSRNTYSGIPFASGPKRSGIGPMSPRTGLSTSPETLTIIEEGFSRIDPSVPVFITGNMATFAGSQAGVAGGIDEGDIVALMEDPKYGVVDPDVHVFAQGGLQVVGITDGFEDANIQGDLNTGITGADADSGFLVRKNTTGSADNDTTFGPLVNVGIGRLDPRVSLDTSRTDAYQLPVGSQGERPSAVDGRIRYNKDTDKFEGVHNGVWLELCHEPCGGASFSVIPIDAGAVAIESIDLSSGSPDPLKTVDYDRLFIRNPVGDPLGGGNYKKIDVRESYSSAMVLCQSEAPLPDGFSGFYDGFTGAFHTKLHFNDVYNTVTSVQCFFVDKVTQSQVLVDSATGPFSGYHQITKTAAELANAGVLSNATAGMSQVIRIEIQIQGYGPSLEIEVFGAHLCTVGQ